MIELSTEAKEVYKHFIGPDGKFIIDENTPSDLVETFQFFNDNNINVLEYCLKKEEFDDDDDDDELDAILDDSIDFNSVSEILIDDSEDNQEELDDLDSMF